MKAETRMQNWWALNCAFFLVALATAGCSTDFWSGVATGLQNYNSANSAPVATTSSYDNGSSSTPSLATPDYLKTVRILSMEVQPSSVPLNNYKQLHVRVYIQEGSGRSGTVWLNQTSDAEVATVFGTGLNFDGGQTIVEGDLPIVCHRPGTMTLQAKLINYLNEESSYDATVTVY